ncbi:MAG: SDR family NAD(P)-dependent oxidoreductase [Chloroflexi bacterium]|nr:SDR family NAD(P)-dependent oxidoreductase [Chloroflexota bacterium]
MIDFSGQVVVITGAAGNLGMAAARAFHSAGAKIAVVDKQREVIRVVFGDDIPEDDTCYFMSANLMDEASVAEMVRDIGDHYGRIDVLVNIAGGFSMGPPLYETPLDTWEFMLNLNARTVFLVSREILPLMIEQGTGKIVSIAARAALAGKANMAPYVVSKSAVVRLTESMAAELSEHNINVNCVLPGTIDTPRNREENPEADFSKWVPPGALADVILFLASDGARAINGAAIPVYGRS